MNESLFSLLLVIVPLLAAGFGYLFKENADRKKILQSEVYKEKREMYQGFVNLIVGLFSNARMKIDTPTEELVDTLYSFYKKYILFASPEVINAFSDYFQFLYHQDVTNHKLHFSRLTKVMAVMREDLGLENTNLGEEGERIFRAIITDFDEIMYPSKPEK
jgi:hypothetical protein